MFMPFLPEAGQGNGAGSGFVGSAWTGNHAISRRSFFTSAGSGLGAMALTSMLAEEGRAAAEGRERDLSPQAPHFPPRAKAGIFIFLAGGPSQVDLVDPKPLLADHAGTRLPESMIQGKRFAFIRADRARVKPSRYQFAKYGQCGMDFSELVPNLATCADDLVLVRSMRTDSFNHLPGHIIMSTGVRQFGHPSLGAWVLYGLGSESRNLPGYVVMTSGSVRGGGANWSNGFLPPKFQGTRFNNQGDVVWNVTNPPGVSPEIQRASLDAVNQLNEIHFAQHRDPQITSRIAAYELAFGMQASAPELVDLSSESARCLTEYGCVRSEGEWPEDDSRGGVDKARSFSRNCLLARRLVERGVRFVTVFHGDWDAHSNLHRGHTNNCRAVDRPIAALIQDLKRRGLLDTTFVVIAGEFGRTCLQEGEDGRDHHPYAFSVLLAGGGLQRGLTYGRTDDFGFEVVENPVHVNDLHATLLHLLGLDHLRLTFRHQGRDMRLTNVGGNVVQGILA
jgi:hypothetical protein